MKVTKIIVTALLAFGLASQVFASPGDLVIVNNTDFPSTSVINHGACSTKLPGGVTKPHSTNVVTKMVVGLACLSNKTNCTADVYMNDKCAGSPVAQVVFDTTTGVKTVTPLDNRYLFTFDLDNPFNTRIDMAN